MKLALYEALLFAFANSIYSVHCLNPLERFDEHLSLRPLRDGKVAVKFSFNTVIENSVPRDPETLGVEDEAQHYSVFPLALGQVLREHAVTEVHLSLNAGNWHYESWGDPEVAGVGSGAELWAWMGESSRPGFTVDERWKGLRNSLAGLFCASLGSLDELRTTSPAFAFKPEGSLPSWNLPHRLRHASMPSEHVCTENLTPFLKLLPCKSLSGIASLLNPHRIFDADWHGMGVHVKWSEKEGIHVELTFQAVFDPMRTASDDKRDFSLDSLFGRKIERPCPAAQSSKILVTSPVNEAYALNPNPSSTGSGKAVYDVHEAVKPFNVNLKWPLESAFDFTKGFHQQALSKLSVRRTLTGSSQAHGLLTIVLRSNVEEEMDLVYLETVPWLLDFYVHSMHAHLNGTGRDDLVGDVYFRPALPHSQPATLQALLTLPAYSTVRLSMEVSKSFLRYTEHPPDAQRGWDLPPAVIVPYARDSTASRVRMKDLLSTQASQRMYTTSLLVDLATPDFSMPYNVIIMSCSLIAMIFGSVFNALTRKFIIVDLAEPANGDERRNR